ncbi:hypothetical protein GCM10023203_24490 [Actinomycetospora straminea]|uniref:Uncharacterized protein n=1 Tax=Actinomycetospora straminea TaxID=663607 RepID=A0ABP9EBN5_9PSEU
MSRAKRKRGAAGAVGGVRVTIAPDRTGTDHRAVPSNGAAFGKVIEVSAALPFPGPVRRRGSGVDL